MVGFGQPDQTVAFDPAADDPHADTDTNPNAVDATADTIGPTSISREPYPQYAGRQPNPASRFAGSVP
jgi:hypothetical protein